MSNLYVTYNKVAHKILRCLYGRSGFFFISSECVRRFVGRDVRRRGGARVAEEGDGAARVLRGVTRIKHRAKPKIKPLTLMAISNM